MSDSKNVSGFRRALRHRDYARYTVGGLLSMSADWSGRIAVGWLTWQFTESPAWLGVMSFSDMAPTVLLSPLAGAYADRFDRLKVCTATAMLSAIFASSLLLLYISGLLSVWTLFAVVVLNGISAAVAQPSRIAIVPNMIPREDLGPAVALNSVTFNLSRFSGPMLAGFILAQLSAGWVFAVNACFQLAFVAVLLRLTSKETDAPKPRGSITADIAEGVRYTMRHPGIGPVMFLLIVSSVGTRPFIDLLPGFAASVFGRGPEGLATLTSTVGLGALAGASYLTIRTAIGGLTRIAVTAVLVIGVGLIAFSMTENFWLAVVCLFVVGVGLSVSATGIMTLVQASVDASMRGRVLSLYGLIFRGGPALGSMTMGWAAQFVGLQIPVAAGAVICIVLWAWTTRNLGDVARTLERESHHERV
ncbi:MAG: MFS transporter [Gemmatimonas sp.]